MPRRSVLSAAEKESLLAWPTDEVQRVHFYSLSSTDLKIIRDRRGDANRLGFAVQLCTMCYPGMALVASYDPPYGYWNIWPALDVSPNCWSDYSLRGATRHEHALDIQSLYGFVSFSRAHVRATVDSLLSVVFGSDQGIMVARALVDNLRQQRVLLPALPVIERLCAQAITQGERQIYAALCDPLTAEHQMKLEELLQVDSRRSQLTRLRWLCGPPGAANPKQILEHIERLSLVTSLDLPPEIGHTIPRHRLLKIARQGLQMTPADLARFEDKPPHGHPGCRSPTDTRNSFG